LSEGDEILAGAAYFPVLGEILAAARGAGCWWNGARCRVSSLATLREATVLTTDERFAGDGEHLAGWRTLSSNAAIARSWGDCYGYLLVATGRAEVMVDGIVSPWDAAALMPIIEEAGGVFTDWKGTRTAFGGSAVATNQGIAVESRQLLVTSMTRHVPP
jgi:histidinol-phosphatase